MRSKQLVFLTIVLFSSVGVSTCASGAGAPVAPTEPPVTPTPGGASLGDTWIRPADGMVMVYVPAGEFHMGSTEGDSDEQPVHAVALDAFWIDRTEVTNGQYGQCVRAGACDPPIDTASQTRSSYYGNSAYADLPVIYVSWRQATAYCEWAGTRLPTEAEWEYAARANAGWRYPWGNSAPSCDRANYAGCVGDTARVGSYPAGASWCGALDLAGNVWEWVADWYGEYPSGRQLDPRGPSSGSDRVFRGGSWFDDREYVRAGYRYKGDEAVVAAIDCGFRCARGSE